MQLTTERSGSVVECLTRDRGLEPHRCHFVMVLKQDTFIRKRNYFSLITKFPAKNGESTPLKNYACAQGTATHQEKRDFSSDDKLRNKRRKRRRNKSSHACKSASKHTDKKLKESSNVRPAQPKPKKKSSALVASQHTDKKRKDSPDVQLAQLKPKKKSPAQLARE